MSESKSAAPAATVHCRRVNAAMTVEEHAECPYCHGNEAEIGSADHERFCSYDPESDPVVYGFPPDSVSMEMRLIDDLNLDSIKANPELQKMALVKRARLSVQPVTKAEFQVIRRMGRRKK